MCVQSAMFVPSGHVPSPYVVYKFYNNDDHDSDIVADSTSPQFNDVKLYTIPADSCLHDYLCREVRV